MVELRSLIQAYISERESFFEREKYKWEAVKAFQENYLRNDISLEERLKASFDVANNLLGSTNYYPAGMLLTFAREKTQETQDCLDRLFNVALPLSDKVTSFINGMENIFQTLKQNGYGDWKDRTNLQSFQDPHAISVYLSLKYPHKYYFYKWTIFKTVADKVGYTIKSKDKVDKLIEYYDFCETVKSEILKEKDFLKDYRNKLKVSGLSDDSYNILTQDFIYAVARYMNADAFQKKGKSIVRNEVTVKASEFATTFHEAGSEFRGKKGIDYAQKDALSKDIGKKGEMWAVNFEKERLAKLGLKYDVRHASLLDGDGLGYDVLSVENDGVTPRYIEVKTTTGGVDTPLYFSRRELERSIRDAAHFYLYRVCNFKDVGQLADVVIIEGSLAELNATPVTYEVSLK